MERKKIFCYRLSNVVDNVFGTPMAFQLCQSSGAAVSLMLLFAVRTILIYT